MADIVHAAVRDYLMGFAPHDDDLTAEVRRRSAADGVPAVCAGTAWLLHVLAAALAPKRIFEIGTGYGVSGLAVARAAGPDSILFTVERDPSRAAVARGFFERAGLGPRTNVMVGEALRLVHKVAGPFDLIVQDGGKEQYGALLDRLVALLRPGGVLVSDNVLWRGDVVPGFTSAPAHSPATVEAIARYNNRLAAHAGLRTVFLPVGDGVAVSVRVEGDV